MNMTKKVPGLRDVPVAAWEQLSTKRICFGHQSVGANILEGIKELQREYPQVKLQTVESAGSVDTVRGAFNHFRVGKNMDPVSKINSFSTAMRQGACKDANVAFFKFCYVDVTPNTDPDALFAYYRREMARLQKLYPQTTFAHVTMPLTKRQSGLKAFVKRALRKPVSGREDNIIRNRFNALLLQEYSGKAPVFDLARIEATRPDGQQEYVDINGTRNFSLVPEYTNDDGHLNENGRRAVAAELLRFLVSLNSDDRN